MHLKLRFETYTILILLASFIALLYETGGYDIQVIRYPKILLWTAITICLILLFTKPKGDSPAKKFDPKDRFKNFMPVAIVFLMGTLYTAGLFYLGFAIPSACFLLAMMMYFGERRPLVLLTITFLFLLLLYGVFIYLLGVPLPFFPSDIV